MLITENSIIKCVEMGTMKTASLIVRLLATQLIKKFDNLLTHNQECTVYFTKKF
jgi:hypothetical protein